MTKDEFLKKYHNYCAQTKEEALTEIEGMEPIELDADGYAEDPIPVYFDGLGWAIMLRSAARYLKEMKAI